MKIVKKLTVWLVVLAMVISFLPLMGTETYAADEVTVSLSSEGILSWDGPPLTST